MRYVRAFIFLFLSVLAAIGLGVGIVAAAGVRTSATLTAAGIGSAHFGQLKAVAIAEITDELSGPTGRQISSGCGPRYSEVEWGDLAAEFRLGVFSGYRYLDAGLANGYTTLKRIESFPVTPRLFTVGGITLGSTFGQVRAVFGKLKPVGTNRNEARNGLIFYDDTETFPDPSSSHITEMKIGTCGDY